MRKKINKTTNKNRRIYNEINHVNIQIAKLLTLFPKDNAELSLKLLWDIAEKIYRICGEYLYAMHSFNKSSMKNSSNDNKKNIYLHSSFALLKQAEGRLSKIIIGNDVYVMFPNRKGKIVLKPGESINGIARVPSDYLSHMLSGGGGGNGREGLHGNELYSPDKQSQIIAALTWLKHCAERSTFAQRGGSIIFPDLSPKSVTVHKDGGLDVMLRVQNIGNFQQLIIDANEATSMFRLYIEPHIGPIYGQELVALGQQVMGDLFDPKESVIRLGNVPVALRVPILKYAIQDPKLADEVIYLTEEMNSPEVINRHDLDKQIGISMWSDEPTALENRNIFRKTKVALSIAETVSVKIPNHIVGVVSGKIEVVAGQVERHGESRMIDSGFNSPLRTEFMIRSDNGVMRQRQRHIAVRLYRA